MNKLVPALWLLVLATIATYHYRYDIGLAKPRFKVGDCVVHAFSDEFRTTYLNYIVLQVGKTDYKLRYYENDDSRADSDFTTDHIEYIDSVFQKTGCPERAQ